jgi:hypothetical protein
MDATGFEIAMSRVYQLLDELDGKPINPSGWSGYDARVYNKSSDKSHDAAVAKLCAACEALGPKIKEHSLELQIWWRDHQQADREREAKVARLAKEEADQKAALEKLSPAERKALGLK